MPHIADKGHAGPGTTAPVAELPGLPLSEADKNLNRAIERIRWRIEQVIAHIEALKTRCRRPVDTLPDAITATLGNNIHLHPMNKPHCSEIYITPNHVEHPFPEPSGHAGVIHGD